QFIDAGGLAITLRVRLAEIAPNSFAGGTAALMADDRHRIAAEIAQARDHRAVVAEAAVAVNLEKVTDQRRQVIERLRPRRMTRHPDPIDRAQTGVELAFKPPALDPNPG